jgi:hypothetical protein
VATRFYLPSAGSSPLSALAIDGNWEGAIASFYRAPLATAKSGSALADVAGRFGSTATRDDCWAQFVSAPLASGYSFTAGDSVTWVARGREDNLACDGNLNATIRIVSGDGATVRGLLVTTLSTGTEWTISDATRVRTAYALAPVDAQAGDRIVVEMGNRGVTPSVDSDVVVRFGDPVGVDDFALTTGLTTDLCPWLALSCDLSFEAGFMTPMRGIW